MKSEIELAVEKKNRAIKSFQDKKEESMALFASARDATLMMTAYAERYKDKSEEELVKQWTWWKNEFYVRYTTDSEVLLRETYKEEVPF